MKTLTLKAYKFEEIEFINKVSGTMKLELKNTYSYNVRYSDQNICKSKFTVTIEDKAYPDDFKIKLVLVGVFEYDPAVERETIHVRTYKELFPYARACVTTLTANAGIQPIMIPDMDIENRDIYRFEKPDNM